MRYDFGKVYKDIRKSKGMTQQDVCGSVLSVTTLSKIENGSVTPKYENMEFLLRQINMSFDEFEYICHYYKPSTRTAIQNKAYNIRSISGSKDLEELLKECEDYLKTHHDFPIEQLYKRLQVHLHVRKHGFQHFSSEIKEIICELWDYLEKQDTWYESDFNILSSILFYFPEETITSITQQILNSLEKYEGYKNILLSKLGLLSHLATLQFYRQDWTSCEEITLLVIKTAKQLKRYDSLAFHLARLGICRKDEQAIRKGLNILTAIEDYDLLEDLKTEIIQFYRSDFFDEVQLP